MGDEMDMVFQKTLVEALPYSYVVLQLSIACARNTKEENHSRERCAQSRLGAKCDSLTRDTVELASCG
jgi:hypothetical protein